MSDLQKYIDKRKKIDQEFSINFDEGYKQFKIGIILRQARESAGVTQQELAKQLNTKKSAISRMENHAEDIKLSTLIRIVSSSGKRLNIDIS
jgi:ribosome-binding protein aMBF1 (putative translation factor)